MDYFIDDYRFHVSTTSSSTDHQTLHVDVYAIDCRLRLHQFDVSLPNAVQAHPRAYLSKQLKAWLQHYKHPAQLGASDLLALLDQQEIEQSQLVEECIQADQFEARIEQVHRLLRTVRLQSFEVARVWHLLNLQDQQSLLHSQLSDQVHLLARLMRVYQSADE